MNKTNMKYEPKDMPDCPGCGGKHPNIIYDPALSMVECRSCSFSAFIGDWLKLKTVH